MGLEILCHGNHLLFQAPSITADGLLSVRLPQLSRRALIYSRRVVLNQLRVSIRHCEFHDPRYKLREFRLYARTHRARLPACCRSPSSGQIDCSTRKKISVKRGPPLSSTFVFTVHPVESYVETVSEQTEPVTHNTG